MFVSESSVRHHTFASYVAEIVVVDVVVDGGGGAGCASRGC